MQVLLGPHVDEQVPEQHINIHCRSYCTASQLMMIGGSLRLGQCVLQVVIRLETILAAEYSHMSLLFCRFKLQEVRSDVGKYPYLLLSSLSDWQSCSGNPNQEAAGFPCLKDTAKFPDVSALAEDLVINVLVGGSQITPFCNGTDAEVCTSLYLGYCSAMGPWFMQASPTWREGLSEENWVVVTWDMFAPTVKNAWRFWNGGAVTVAHELGHYLGLMHTHEGATPCEGDGLTKADAVPDTPVNLQTEQWAYQNGLAMQLAKWCAEFRNSKSPSSRDLLQFNSCKKVNTVDNVFNIMSYVPDACCMIFTENQVARLQWAITNFRPKLMAKFAA